MSRKTRKTTAAATPRRVKTPKVPRRFRAVGEVDPRRLPPGAPYACDDPHVGTRVAGDDFAGTVVGCATPPAGKRGRYFTVGTVTSGSAIGRAKKRSAARREALRERYEGPNFDARPKRRTKTSGTKAPPSRGPLALPAPAAEDVVHHREVIDVDGRSCSERSARRLPVIQPRTRRRLPVVQPERRPPMQVADLRRVVDVFFAPGPLPADYLATLDAIRDALFARTGENTWTARDPARAVSPEVAAARVDAVTRRRAIRLGAATRTLRAARSLDAKIIAKGAAPLIEAATLRLASMSRAAPLGVFPGDVGAAALPSAPVQTRASDPAPSPAVRRHLPVIQPRTRRRLPVVQPVRRPPEMAGPAFTPRPFEKNPAPTDAAAPVGAVLGAAASPSVAADADRWSPYQRAIFSWIAEGSGNAVVEAVAGSGKSTTIVEAVRRIPSNRTVLILAFNVSVKDELSGKFKGFPNVTVRTLNGHGYKTMATAWAPVSTPPRGDERAAQLQDDARFNDILRAARVPPPFRAWRNLSAAEQARWRREGIDDTTYQREVMRWNYDYDALKELIELCRGFLATTPDAIAAVQLEYDKLRTRRERTRGTIVAKPWTFRDPRVNRVFTTDDVIRWVQDALRASLVRPSDGRVARFDAVFPVASLPEMQPETFDWIFVDETQDMDVAQLRVVQKSVAPGGRVVVVGDGKQAIYRFRGADMTAMQRMEVDLSARRLPLSVSYRVPACAADLARRVVPWFEVPAGTPQGTCDRVSAREMVRNWRDGDFVIARTNAPLVPLAIMAIQQGRDVLALGLGDMRRVLKGVLDGAVRKAPAWRTPDDLRDAIDAYGTAEKDRVMRQEVDKRMRYGRRNVADVEALVADLPAIKTLDLAIDALKALLDRARSPEALEKKIAELQYSGGRRDEPPPEHLMRGKLVFTTVHKIKGAEANRTWILDETFGFRGELSADGSPLVKHGQTMTDAARQEEVNLWYVAITRAKNLRADAAAGTAAAPGAVYFVEGLSSILGGGYVDEDEESAPRDNPSRARRRGRLPPSAPRPAAVRATLRRRTR